jgi:predicted dehydrogenase
MAGPIRVGIVGANPTRGWALSAHLPALTALPSFKVTAVSTTRSESAAETAARFSIPHSYDNAKALAENDDVDLVVISVKVPYHHELTKIALDAGKHVFTEWPLGANVEQATELTELAKARGVHHIVGLQGRQSPLVNYMRHLVSDGYVGRVLSVTLTISSGQWGGATIAPDRAWTADRANGANLLTITGGHSLDTLRYALGELAEVNGVVATLHPTAKVAGTDETVNITVPDNVLLNGRMADGAVASVMFLTSPSLASAPDLAGTHWSVFGEEGTLWVSGSGLPHFADTGLTLRGHTGSGPLEELTVPASYHKAPAEVPEGPARNVAALYQSVADAITGGTPIESSFETALSLHHLLDAIQSSSDQGERRRAQ